MNFVKDKNKILYWSLIVTFAVLYLATAFVSWYHSITFFNIANEQWLSIILSFVAEIGQASVLFAILLTKNKNRLLPWTIMIILTTLQVIGNVVSSYKFMQTSNSIDFTYFKDSILFWVETTEGSMFKIIIAWITGGILPVVALSMTALVAENLHLAEEELKEEIKPQEVLEEIKEIKNDNINNTSIDLNLIEKNLKEKEEIIEHLQDEVHTIKEDFKEIEDKEKDFFNSYWDENEILKHKKDTEVISEKELFNINNELLNNLNLEESSKIEIPSPITETKIEPEIKEKKSKTKSIKVSKKEEKKPEPEKEKVIEKPIKKPTRTKKA